MEHNEVQVNKEKVLVNTVPFEEIAERMNITPEEREQIDAKKKYYRTLLTCAYCHGVTYRRVYNIKAAQQKNYYCSTACRNKSRILPRS